MKPEKIDLFTDISILPYSPTYEQGCADMIAVLPDWFGIPEANAAYLESLSKFPSWVAIKEGKVVGVITLVGPYPASFEIHFMAVHPSYHRQGIGIKLVEFVEGEARKSEGKWLHVKTLSASHPDPFYARTREFYYALGFTPLFETGSLWGPENPAVILIKAL